MSVALLRQRNYGDSIMLSCSLFPILCHPSALFPDFPECNTQLGSFGTHFSPEITQIFFFFFFSYLLSKNVYLLYFAMSNVLQVSSPSTLLPPSPQTQVLCNAVNDQPTLELEYQHHWESSEKYLKSSPLWYCPCTSLMGKYKASVDFAELTRNRTTWIQASPFLQMPETDPFT